MLKTLAGLALASAVFTAPALAQGRETEFGVDLAVRWMKSSGGGDAVLQLQTPVAVRVAFHTAGSLAVEPRFTATFLLASGGNAYVLDPGVNLLFGLPGRPHNDGAYCTVGADVGITGGTGMTSRSVWSLNAGVGLRRPMGKAASRAEVFLGFTPKQGTTVTESIFAVGLRLGISFFN
jgi:hypothetical protein